MRTQNSKNTAESAPWGGNTAQLCRCLRSLFGDIGVERLAAKLNVAPQTVWRWIREGKEAPAPTLLLMRLLEAVPEAREFVDDM